MTSDLGVNRIGRIFSPAWPRCFIEQSHKTLVTQFHNCLPLKQVGTFTKAIIFTQLCVAYLRKKGTRRNDAECLLHREDIPRQLFNFFLSKTVSILKKKQRQKIEFGFRVTTSPHLYNSDKKWKKTLGPHEFTPSTY